jgi:hypothetical protein
MTAEKDEWQGIESAPKDGTGFLGWNAEWETSHEMYWLHLHKTWSYGSILLPTHWMPLPAPPNDDDKPYRWCATHNDLMLGCDVASPDIARLSREAAEKTEAIRPHPPWDFDTTTQATSIIESVLKGSNVYRAGVEAAIDYLELMNDYEVAVNVRNALLPTGSGKENDNE